MLGFLPKDYMSKAAPIADRCHRTPSSKFRAKSRRTRDPLVHWVLAGADRRRLGNNCRMRRFLPGKICR